jgi:hypothetical protein
MLGCIEGFEMMSTLKTAKGPVAASLTSFLKGKLKRAFLPIKPKWGFRVFQGGR